MEAKYTKQDLINFARFSKTFFREDSLPNPKEVLIKALKDNYIPVLKEQEIDLYQEKLSKDLEEKFELWSTINNK